MTYAQDTELTFTVTAKALGNGNVQIGCKTFTEGEINEVAKDLTVKAPPAPEREPGDVLLLVEAENAPFGTAFIVGPDRYGAGYEIWSVNAGTRAPEDWWLKDAGATARFVKVASGATAFRSVTSRRRDERAA